MKLSAILAPLIAAKADHELIMAQIVAFEKEQESTVDQGKEKARARWHKWNDKRLQTLANVSGPLTRGDTRGEDNLLPKKITGQEENKKEAPQATPRRATRLPADWQIPEEWLLEAMHGAHLTRDQASAEARAMHNWSLSDRNGAKLDWQATWRNWFARAARPRGQAPPGHKRNFADVAMERVNGHGSESIFGSSGDAKRISAGRSEPGPHVEDVRGGIAGRIIRSGH